MRNDLSSPTRRIAVLSDVHGNLPALEAVLSDLASANIDLTINLGDCVSGPLWPSETAELLEKADWLHVRGNHDRYVSSLPLEAMAASDAFACRALSERQRTWLGSLPTTVSPLPGIVGVHGSPGSDEEFLLEERVSGRLVLRSAVGIRLVLGEMKASILLCGHSHLPRHVRLNDALDIVNPGSVGLQAFEDTGPDPLLMETGSPHARYAVLESGQDLCKLEFRTVPYDWRSAASKAVREGRNDWKVALETGYVATRAGHHH